MHKSFATRLVLHYQMTTSHWVGDKTPEAIIAATTLAYGYTLITRNEKDFGNIKGLKLVNPHKM